MEESKKNYGVFILLSLTVSIVAVSFAYAALTHTLKIHTADSGDLSGESWIVEFINLSKVKFKPIKSR